MEMYSAFLVNGFILLCSFSHNVFIINGYMNIVVYEVFY